MPGRTPIKRLPYRGEIRELFGFIDRFLYLPPPHQEAFRMEVTRLEEEKRMEILSTFEEAALEKGRKEGHKEGRLDTVMDQVEARFGRVPEGLAEQLGKLSLGKLKAAAQQIVLVGSLAEFEAWLLQQQKGVKRRS